MSKYGIDVKTTSAKELIKRLKELKGFTVTDGGKYNHCPEYSQVHVTTTWKVEKLEQWLYDNKYGIEYVGVFLR